MEIDRTKPYGEISPPWDGAHYEQSGRYFGPTGHFLAEHTGNKGKFPPVTSMPEKKDPQEVESITALQLLATMDQMSYFAFRAHAERVLSRKLPGKMKKDEILRQVEEAGRKEEADQKKEGVALTWNGVAGKEEVNLTAWAKGTQNYLAAEVFSAINERYHKRVSNIRDAVEFLIDEGVVSANQARDID